MSVLAAELSVALNAVRLGGQLVLQDVCFECAPGEHVVVLAPNGAGKSTLLRATAGLIPFDGTVTLEGTDVGTWSARERARRIAYVPQQSQLASVLSVDEVVGQARYCHGAHWSRPGKADLDAVDRALTRTDTLHLRERAYLHLSGGEQRRVLIARALATEASVILLDEPAAALDISHALELYALLRSLVAEGRTVVTVLHQLQDAERWGDRLIVLRQGRVYFDGCPPLSAEHLSAVFGVTVERGGGPRFSLVGGE